MYYLTYSQHNHEFGGIIRLPLKTSLFSLTPFDYTGSKVIGSGEGRAACQAF